MTGFRKATDRRTFLKRCAGIALGSAALPASYARLQLALAQTTPADDYKALVCVFLHGGNDSYNMFIPTSSQEYELYALARQDIAVPQADILPVNPVSARPDSYGFHPAMNATQRLFEERKLALLANTGTLIEPVIKGDRNNILPPKLFSHDDQQTFAQALDWGANVGTGWAGRAADVMQSMNINQRLSMNISLGGSNIFQRGDSVSPYSISGQGVQELQHFPASGGYPVDQARSEIFRTLLQNADSHLLQREYASMQLRAWQLSGEVTEALTQQPALQTAFPTSRLATDLQMVAHLISARSALEVNRQVYFVGMGGFDTHSGQLSKQPELLSQLSEGLYAFNAAMEELGVADKVTTFTMSEFGRTLTSNGDGTDHGWGGHQLVMGGAVSGGEIFGKMPSLELDGEDDLFGDGRMIPSTSIDQYGATLATWFGLPAADFGNVFPNLRNFETADLGFMKP